MNLVFSDSDLNEVISVTDNLFGFDFSDYAPESLKRRLIRLMKKLDYPKFYDFKYALTNGNISKEVLLNEITVNVTDMFRDPEVFHEIIQVIFPYFKSFPELKVWHAGCSSGQEMYA